MLTRQEFAILRAVIDGLVYKEVGAKLNITARTVKYHMGNIYRKLGLKTINKGSGISAVVWWAKNGAPDTWAQYVKLRKSEFDEIDRAKNKIIQLRRTA